MDDPTLADTGPQPVKHPPPAAPGSKGTPHKADARFPARLTGPRSAARALGNSVSQSLWTPQAGVIAYTLERRRGVVVCLVSANSGGWTLPKGHIDPGHLPHESAAVEAFEEAGLLGDVAINPVGSYDYHKLSGKQCRVHLFPMRITTILESWDEKHARERIWIEPAEADAWLELPGPVGLLSQFGEMIEDFLP